MGSPVDKEVQDALDRLAELVEQAKWKCSEDPNCPDCAAEDAALATVRERLERLRRHPDAWSQEAFDKQKARAEAAEAEVQRLREGLDRLADAAEVFVPDERYVDEQGDDLERAVIEARALLAGRPDGDCEHEWVSARNEAVLSGLICVKCHALAAEPDGGGEK